VKGVKISDAAGAELKLGGHGLSGGGNQATFSCSCKGGFPPQARVVVEVYDELQKYRIPFRLENITLLGAPMK